MRVKNILCTAAGAVGSIIISLFGGWDTGIGTLGGAEANCKYYAGGNRGASAQYFVGFDGEVWQSVEDQNIAWHCGAKAYKHPECRQ